MGRQLRRPYFLGASQASVTVLCRNALPAGGQYCSHSKRISVLAPKADIGQLSCRFAMSSSAKTPSSLTSTSPPRCIALMARLFVDLSKVDHATITERAILG